MPSGYTVGMGCGAWLPGMRDAARDGGRLDSHSDSQRVDTPALSAEHNQGQWYALYVRSHCERATEQRLKGKGYRAFSPFYQTWRKRADRTKQLDLPLFPGYVFCCFNPNKRGPILTTPGVVIIVGAGKTPEPVMQSEIDSIQIVAEAGRTVQPWPFLRQDQRVRIEAGPLAGIEGTLLTAKGQLRLVVSITLLQRAMAVEVDQEVVRPLFDTPHPVPCKTARASDWPRE
jgi:transcription antitermination factor NusG